MPDQVAVQNHIHRRTLDPPDDVGNHPPTKQAQHIIRGRMKRVPSSLQLASQLRPFERLRRKRKGHPATGRPSLQGRIVPTEAIDSVKTFCRNLMSLKTGVSSDFWEINAFIFNKL